MSGVRGIASTVAKRRKSIAVVRPCSCSPGDHGSTERQRERGHQVVDLNGSVPELKPAALMDGSNELQYSAPSSGNGVATMVITMADRTNEEKDLALVQELLAGPAGIMLERIEATSEGPRPDFRLVSWRGFAGFCEVKSPRDDWLDEQLEQAPPLTVVGGARSDPTFNRIARNIEKAVRQFDAVNPDHGVPNVLVLQTCARR